VRGNSRGCNTEGFDADDEKMMMIEWSNPCPLLPSPVLHLFLLTVNLSSIPFALNDLTRQCKLTIANETPPV